MESYGDGACQSAEMKYGYEVTYGLHLERACPILCFLATVPIIPFILVFVIMTIRGNDKKSSIQLSMDVTTAFLFGCVASLLNDRLGTSFDRFFCFSSC